MRSWKDPCLDPAAAVLKAARAEIEKETAALTELGDADRLSMAARLRLASGLVDLLDASIRDGVGTAEVIVWASITSATLYGEVIREVSGVSRDGASAAATIVCEALLYGAGIDPSATAVPEPSASIAPNTKH